MIRAIAEGEGLAMVVDESTRGGASFSSHRDLEKTKSLLSSSTSQEPWDFIVLQDQSTIPSGAKGSNSKQESLCALSSFFAPLLKNLPSTRPVLYSTWGRRDTYTSKANGEQLSFEVMNARTSEGYRDYKLQLQSGGVPLDPLIAPAGKAFGLVKSDGDNSPVSHYDLYDPDGTHPSLKGSYLVASLYYGMFFERNPTDISYRPPGISAYEATYLRSIAASALNIDVDDGNVDASTSTLCVLSSTVARCGCTSCTEEVWEARASDGSGDHSCGGRINWKITADGFSELEACSFVSEEFPQICGPACDPNRCNS